VAGLPQAGLLALGQVLPAAGRPGAASVGEFVSLVITVPGLILLLPALGAMGAALISVVAYTTTFAILLAVTTRHFGHRWVDYLLPRRADLAMLIRLVQSHWRGLRGR
jgi:O-antigen/teichoic acid export membrane protein